MKAILVPVEQHSFMRSVLDAALLVAGRFGSHVEGLALGPDIPDVIAFDVPVGWAILTEKEQRELVERSNGTVDGRALVRELKAVGGNLRSLRLALTGQERGPELWTVIAALPRDEMLRRIDAAL